MFSGMMQLVKRTFGGVRHGPYNPYRYKDYYVPRTPPTNQEINAIVDHQYNSPLPNLRNVRHINPVRQSGPIPPYSGTYTMEDIRKIWFNTTISFSGHPCQMDVDEVMRRVPGITRKEVQHIVKLGLTPQQQVDYAYLVLNMGLDCFFQSSIIYVGRQVVTNSKGEKVQIYLPYTVYEDSSFLPCGFAPVKQMVDNNWEAFLWGDVPIKVVNDLDLCVPNTWFEYEAEFSNQLNMVQDQVPIPQDIRPFDTGRNPHARTQLWKSHEKLDEEGKMLEENWKPLL